MAIDSAYAFAAFAADLKLEDDLRGVFADCSAHAALTVPDGVCDGVYGLCRNLETLQSVSELAAYLTWER